jgi:hypothetical protein
VGIACVCGSVPGSTLGVLEGACGGDDGCPADVVAGAVPGVLAVPPASVLDDATEAVFGLDEEPPQPAIASITTADVTAHSPKRVLI